MLHRIALYVGVVIVFLSMIAMGALPKLAPDLPLGPLGGDPVEMRNMWTDVYGYPLWFRRVTGVLELVAAVLILIPSVRFWGGLLTACIMIGAAITNLRAGERLGDDMVTFVLINVIIFVAAALVVWQSFRQWHATQE